MIANSKTRIFFAALLAAAAFGAHADQVVWRTDIGTAMAEARASGKIVMVDVYTDWCGWCTKLDEETYQDPVVASLLSAIVAVKVNPEKGGAGAQFVEPYKITGFPNILFLDSTGKLLDRIDGFMDAAAFAKRLAAIYKSHGVVVAAGKSDGASIDWLRDIDAALARAKSQRKIVMVDVYADWCGWCTKLDEETYSDKGVIDLLRGFVNLKVDGDDKKASGAFTGKYRVSGYPTILFLDSDGSVVNRIGGFVDATEFARQIRRTSDNRDKLKSYAAESARGDHRNAQAFITLLLEVGRADEAIPLFDRLSGGSVFPPDARAELALELASSLIDSDGFAKALSYISLVERMSPPSPSLHKARFYRSIVLYYTEGKASALSYLDGLIASAATPEDWKANYRKIRAQIEKAK